MSTETAWYRGRTPKGLQIGEPYPSTQVNIKNNTVVVNMHSYIDPIQFLF